MLAEQVGDYHVSIHDDTMAQQLPSSWSRSSDAPAFRAEKGVGPGNELHSVRVTFD
jgi:hypothetical protein